MADEIIVVKEGSTQLVQQPADAQQAAKPVRKRRAATAAANRPKRASSRVVLSKSKRKSAVARASARPGSGRVTINGFDINTVEPLEHRRLMLEPASVSPDARAVFSGMDIKVSVYGGGTSSQAQAVRGAIAKSIVSFSGSESIKREYLNYDRFMVVDDARRVEPKKFKGPKARARFQKSYR